VEIGTLHTPGVATDVEVVGDTAYVAAGARGLHIVDVSDPAVPVALGALDTPGIRAAALEVMGDLAYVADDHFGLRIIDVSDPAIPVELAALETPGSAQGVEVVGDLAFVADRRSGLRVIDVSNPAFPVEVGAMTRSIDAFDVEVVGDLAYVADVIRGLWVIDISDPTRPVRLGSFIWGKGALDVEVVGDLAYLIHPPGVRVIDVSDPTFPVELGAFHTSGYAYDVDVVGDLVYVADWRSPSGLRIIDFGPEYATTTTVDIDIKPGSNPNSINPDDGGVVPVALLGSDAFDVSEVDVATLKFGPDDAAPDHTHGPHVEDVNADGLPDLLVHFDTGESGIVFGTLVACVNGEMLDGKPFSGCDAVRTVPDMDGDKLLDVEEAAIGTDALNPDTDGDGFEDGQEVLLMGTDPLNARDPKPVRERRGGRKRSR
jgi:hypothetical protein